MAKAIDMIVDSEFVSEYDDDEVKTTWILRTLSGIEFLKCTSKGYVDHEMIIDLGLTGWRDFKDSNGHDIQFSQQDIIRIPPMILQDISFAIQNLATLGEDERKNS